jgi:hypothetical protein
MQGRRKWLLERKYWIFIIFIVIPSTYILLQEHYPANKEFIVTIKQYRSVRNSKSSRMTDDEVETYSMKPNIHCTPHYRCSDLSLTEAKSVCTSNPVCAMFYRNEHNRLCFCAESARTNQSSTGSLFYLQQRDKDNLPKNIVSRSSLYVHSKENCFQNSTVKFDQMRNNQVHIMPLDVNCFSRGIRNHTNTIFFVEASRIFKFKSIQWCSIESAAYNNPNKDIVVVFLYYNVFKAPTIFKKISSEYKNIHFVHISSMSEFVSDSPYENDLQCKRRECALIEESAKYGFRDYNYSDLMRVLIVYKFGGLYSDLDIVALKPLPDNLPIRFMTADSSRRLSTVYFRFEKKSPFLNELMKDIVDNFDPTKWGANGPGRYTESLKKYCDNFNDTLPQGTFGSRTKPPKITQCKKQQNHDIGILGPTFVALIHWNDAKSFFKPIENHKNGTNLISKLHDFDSIAAHFWNKITNREFERNHHDSIKKLPFKQIFLKNCPLTYNEWFI